MTAQKKPGCIWDTVPTGGEGFNPLKKNLQKSWDINRKGGGVLSKHPNFINCYFTYFSTVMV